MPLAPETEIAFRRIISAAVTDVAHSGDTFQEAIARLPAMSRTILEASARVAAAGGDEAAVAAAESAGESLAEFVDFPVVLGAVAVLILARRIHDTERSLVGHIPWVGGKLQALVDLQYPFIDQVEGWVINQLVSQVSTILPALSNVVWWALSGHLGGIPNPEIGAIDARIDPLHTQLDHLASQVQLLTQEIAGYSPAGATQTSGGPTSVQGATARLDAIEVRNDHQGQEISQLNQRMAALEGAVAQLGQNVAHLISSVYGARASLTGVQDLVGEVEALRSQVLQVQAHQQSELQDHADALAQLAPLLSLMYLGERGLQNLRTLEDNMCQCPALPRFGFEIPDALAIEMAIANGI